MRNLYEVLGIEKTATPVQIRKAYRRLMSKVHPDVCGGAREAYDEAATAHEVLMDPNRRDKYDATGTIDPAVADNTIAQLIGTLVRLFNEVMQSLIAQGHDPKAYDLVALMIDFSQKGFTEVEAQRPNLEKARASLTELLGRFDVVEDEAPNHMDTIIRSQLADIERRMKLIQEQQAELKRASIYLQGCKFNRVNQFDPLMMQGQFIVRNPYSRETSV